MKALVRTLLILFIAAFGDPQQASAAPMNQYAVKVICGDALPMQGGVDAIAIPGGYLTAINVHNPARDTPALVFKKFSLGLPRERSGEVTQYFSTMLDGDATLQIDCANIRTHLAQP